MIRIIYCLDIKNNKVVKGITFKKLKIINDPLFLCIKYCNNFIDELILLDITSNYTKKSLSYNIIKKISKKINIPLSIGGGINNIFSINKLLKIGTDKIVLNSVCYKNIFLIKNISNLYGSQCLIISIDSKIIKKKIKTYKNSGYFNTNFNLLDWVIIVKKIGSGEILITSILNDGKRNGYNIITYYYIKKNIEIQLIISGGMGSINDIFFIYKFCNINSFLIASLFHYNYISPNILKKYGKIFL